MISGGWLGVVVSCVDLGGKLMDLVFTIAWLIWFERNSVVHNNSSWFPGGIIDKAEAILAEFRDANVTEQWVNHSLPFKWDSFPREFFKVNFDVSCSIENKNVEIGVVVRDYMGEFYAGMSKLGNMVASAETT